MRLTPARKSRAASEEEQSRKSPGLKDSLFDHRKYPKDIRDLLKKKPAATPPTSGGEAEVEGHKEVIIDDSEDEVYTSDSQTPK